MNKMAQITYDDKEALNENPSVAGINKVTDDNMSQGTKNSLSTGGDGAHNNLQPYIVINYIISY